MLWSRVLFEKLTVTQPASNSLYIQNLKFHYSFNKGLPLVSVLSNFSKIYFNNKHSYLHRPSKWFLFLLFPYKNPECTFSLSCMHHKPHPFIFLHLMTKIINVWWGVWIIISSFPWYSIVVKMSRKLDRPTDIGIYLPPDVIPRRGILISSTHNCQDMLEPTGTCRIWNTSTASSYKSLLVPTGDEQKFDDPVK